LIETSLDGSTDSLAVEGDWLTVTSSPEEGSSASSLKDQQFSKHLLNTSFKQSLTNDFTEIECIISQLILSTSRASSTRTASDAHPITNEQLTTTRREIREILILLIQPRFLKSLEILTSNEYREQ
jgi:hypothetical protein